jgi:hypothetical protein
VDNTKYDNCKGEKLHAFRVAGLLAIEWQREVIESVTMLLADGVHREKNLYQIAL